MLKKLLVTTALSGLMLSSALAQSSPPSSSSSSAPSASSSDAMKPSASSDAMKPSASSDSMKPSASSSSPSTTASSASAGSASTISSQSADQLLASKIKGADVYGSNDEKIGDVSDMLFSKDGKIEAYILSVGGFLGVGAKEVALAPASIQLTQDKDNWKLKVTMTKDQLAQAPNFERYKEQRTTTGASSSGASSSGSGMSPSSTAPRNAPSGSTAK